MHFEFAQPGHTRAVIDLWQQCFGDSPSFVSFYLQHHPFGDQTLLLALEGDVVLSMLSLLPCELYASVGRLATRYVYAVGTDIRFRGRGLSTALLDEATRLSRARGDQALFLIPASQSLFSFYGARGFQPAFGITHQDLSLEQVEQYACASPLSLAPVSPPVLRRLRDNAFASYAPYVAWDAAALSYAVRASRAAGGDAVMFLRSGVPFGYAFYEPHEDGCHVKEWAVPDEDTPDALLALHAKLHAQGYRLRRPGQTPFGLLRWTGEPCFPLPASGYAGLILD